MPEISLHEYEFEIDQLIEEARYLEAYAHLRHIISKFPHYIGAYYLMGKMLLEADQPDLAVDIFRRALNADPEHLKSRIGLGLAHEQRDDLNAAIWNLERAFELAPANADINEELRRIYGRRDGKDPDHIPISRAGLSRLYMRGNLSSRAVDELRNLLTTEPARPDLQGALAEAYWRDEQIVQAAEMCQSILDKMPYNRKANLLLGTLWVNSGQEEGQVYLKRSQEVDVENVLAVELLGTNSPLKQREVVMDRLVYDMDTIDVDQQAEWFRRLEATSVSVGISEAVPDMSESDVRLVDITAGLESQIEIPDWLRELGSLDDGTDQDSGLGWMSNMILGEELEGKDAKMEVVEPPAVEIEFPEIVSAGAYESTDAKAQSEPVDESADWLNALVAEEDDETTEIVPEWLEEITPKSSEIVETEQPVETLIESAVQVGQDEIEAGLDQVEAQEPMTISAEDTILTPEYEEELEETPDWLQAIVPPSLEEKAGEPAPAGDVLMTPDRFDESVSQADHAELSSYDEEQLQQDAPEEISELTLTESSFEEEDADVPDWLQALNPTKAETTLIDQRETPGIEQDWLDEIVAEIDVDESLQTESESSEDAQSEELPDWLQVLAPETAEEKEIKPLAEDMLMDKEELESAELDWLDEISPGMGTDSALPDSEISMDKPSADVPDWLKALAPEKTGATVMQPMGEGEAESAELDWLDELSTDMDTASPLTGSETATDVPTVTTDIPDWISQLQPTSQVTDEIELSEEEIPDWLAAFNKSEPATSPELTPDRIEEFDNSDSTTPPVQKPDTLKETEFFGWQAFGEEIAEATASSDGPILTDTTAPLTLEEEELPVNALESLADAAPDKENGDGLFGWDAFGETITEATPQIETPLSQEETAVSEGEFLSGDDALAWLESLTSGKEDELRAQAELDSEARIAEIMGRRTTPVQEEVSRNLQRKAIREPEPEPMRRYRGGGSRGT